MCFENITIVLMQASTAVTPLMSYLQYYPYLIALVAMAFCHNIASHFKHETDCDPTINHGD